MIPRVSILLPSKHPTALARTLDNISAATRGSYEVIVVSPPAEPGADLEPWGEPVRRIYSSAVGPIATQAVALKYATGLYVLAFADDFLLMDGWDDQAVADHEAAVRREISTYLLGLRHEVVGTVFGTYYANFPFMLRETAERVGWYDHAFVRGFGDCDLSLRVWGMKEGRVEWSSHQLVRSTPDDARKGSTLFDPNDFRIFLDRWLWDYREFTPTIEEFDDFSMNVRLTDTLVSWRSFYKKHRELMRALSVPRLVSEWPDYNVVHYRGLNYKVPHSRSVDLTLPEDRATLEVVR